MSVNLGGRRSHAHVPALLLFAAASMLMGLMGCSPGAGSGSSGNNITVAITNKITSVQAGAAAIVFNATVQNDANNSGVTWSLTANGASCSPVCGTLSQATSTGVTYTPPSSAPASPNNQPTITATSVAKSNKSDSDSFTISAPPAISVTISNKFTSVNAGASPFLVNASVQNDPTSSGVTWTLTGTNCANNACGTLTGTTPLTMTYTPPASVTATLNATITAISVHDNSKLDSSSFTIVKPTISLNIGNKVRTVFAGSTTILFNANVYNDSPAAPNGVFWTLTSNGSACSPACGSIPANAEGQLSTMYTPPSTVPTPATVTLTATSYADGTKSDFDTFTIASLPPVSITITPVSSVLAHGTGTIFSASIENDPSSIPSVSWSLTLGGSSCAPATCGSLTNIQTTSVTYVPPSSAVSSVRITATSNYDATKSASDTFNVTSSASNACGTPGGKESLLHGQYALLLQGFWGPGNGTPMLIAGSFAANGSGGVIGGEEDINDAISPQHLIFDSSNSLYTVGADDRGCLQLTNSSGTTTVFRFALGGISSGLASKARIMEFDDNSSTGAGYRGSGILRLQDTTAFTLNALKPGYAFGVGGWSQSGNQWVHLAAAGSFTSSNGTLNGVFDENIGGIVFSEATGVNGSIGSISPTTGRADAKFPQYVFDWEIYIINSSEFFVIGTDPVNYNPLSIGVAIATGNSFNAASLSGNYVLHATGNVNGSADATLQVLSMTPGGAQTGTLSGTVYSYGGGNAAQSTTLTGVTYNVDPASGRTTLGNASDNLPILYLTTPTDGVAGFVAGVNSDAIFGLLEPQTSQSLSAGTYIFGTENPADNSVVNKSGVETIASGGAISGTYDQSSTSGLQPNQPLNTALTLNSSGAGNVGPSTVAVTTGSRLFSIDESGNSGATIIAAEQ